MSYKLSPKAEIDLEHLYRDGFHRFGEKQADAYAVELIGVFELIAANPRIARLRHEVQPPVRVHPHGSHILIYEEQNDGILILRIRHARENWQEGPV